MSFVRKKGNHFYLVESVRNGSKVRQKVIAYLGASPTARDAAAECVRGIRDEQTLLKALNKEVRQWMREPELWMEKDKLKRFRNFTRDGKVNPLKRKIRASQNRIRGYKRTIAKLRPYFTASSPRSQSGNPLPPVRPPRSE